MQDPVLLSQVIVKFSRQNDEIQLDSLRGSIACSEIENFSAFPNIKDDSYLLLERREKQSYRLIRVAAPGTVLNEVYRLAQKHQLDFSFPEAVESELAEILRSDVSFRDLEDYTYLPFVTVDGEGTMDLDQALFVQKGAESKYNVQPECEFVVWYAIADPSYFIRYGTALYEDALLRGASIYFAGLSAPMLPRALSTGIISLNAGVDRRALLFVMQLNNEGICIKTDLIRAKIHCVEKISNEELSAYYKAPQDHRFNKQKYTQSLWAFKEAAILRMQEARTRNVVHFNRVNLDVSLDIEQDRFVLGFDARDEVSLYNEQLSLLCNMEGAKFLLQLQKNDPEILAIFRNHEAPGKEDLIELEQNIDALYKAHNLEPCWHWNRTKQSLSDYLDALPESRQPEQKNYRLRQAIERQVLMMQRRSVFAPAAGLHSALGVNPYARFSAPMREIVGVFTHKEVIQGLELEPFDLSLEQNNALRNRVIDAANRAKDVQNSIAKAIDSCAIAHAISRDYEIPEQERPIRTGTILGMKASALYVRLDSPPIELKVYIKDIIEAAGQNYVLNESKTVLQSQDESTRYVVGGAIGLRVHTYNAQKNKWSVLPAACATQAQNTTQELT